MQSVYDVLTTLPDTTTFVRLIRVARNDPTVASLTDPSFVGTVFVPTDNVSHEQVQQASQPADGSKKEDRCPVWTCQADCATLPACNMSTVTPLPPRHSQR
jgi:hypothetical protein